ncbi:MAG: hypothetical protein J6S85_21820 [Methanobrevibacter sp.]|nr:hypothetical protein [Methanobrevibacter sp.]
MKRMYDKKQLEEIISQNETIQSLIELKEDTQITLDHYNSDDRIFYIRLPKYHIPTLLIFSYTNQEDNTNYLILHLKGDNDFNNLVYEIIGQDENEYSIDEVSFFKGQDTNFLSVACFNDPSAIYKEDFEVKSAILSIYEGEGLEF